MRCGHVHARWPGWIFLGWLASNGFVFELSMSALLVGELLNCGKPQKEKL